MNLSPRVSSLSLTIGSLVLVILVLVSTPPTRAQNSALAPAFSLARAVVVDIRDPQSSGRIKIRYPWLPEEAPVWARFSLPPGGIHRPAALWFPEVGDEVVIGFDQGDLRLPIVLGFLWNGDHSPAPGH
ncbi:MAG TPA: phage baseplate assembly protein V [Thermoanaerobaculia bacterium]|nr:phage baseplate assembly protein V [Thermoanaerobaculia bacterium]